MIFGDKVESWFDVWSFEHLMTGVTIGAFLIARNARRGFPAEVAFHIELISVLCSAYMWETMEFYLETGLGGKSVLSWFHGVEFWGNRLVTDPIMVVLGWLLMKHHRHILWPARTFSLAWLCAHVAVFPHSMYLQDMIASVSR